MDTPGMRYHHFFLSGICLRACSLEEGIENIVWLLKLMCIIVF